MQEPFMSHFIARIPLIFLTGIPFCACEHATWHETGWIVGGFLILVLLTHRLHNRAAKWVDDNTDWYGPT